MTDQQLRFRLRLTARALFPLSSETPQVTATTPYIPGSVLWGALGARWLERYPPTGRPFQDRDFHRLFARAGLRVLNAYPVSPEQRPARTLPLPRSLVAEKRPGTVWHDLAVDRPAAGVSVRDLGGWGAIRGGTVYRTEARRSLQYHTERDPLSGRPTQEAGALFVYESLDPGQEFEGLVLGEEADLRRLAPLLAPGGAPFRLGRSKSAGYGGNVEVMTVTGPEPATTEAPVAFDAAGRLVVTLLSPLAVRSEDGLGSPRFPYDELAALLAPAGAGPDGEALERSRTFSRTAVEVAGGHAGHWGLSRAQVPALSAGSVWVFEGPALHFTRAWLEAAALASLGMRTGEGFGRFALNWHGQQRPAPGTWTVSRPAPLTGPPPALFRQIDREVTATRWARKVEVAAVARAGEFAGAGQWPPQAVLGRLRLLVRDSERTHAQRRAELEHGGWRAPAIQALRRPRVDGRSLLDDLLEAFQIDPATANHPVEAIMQSDRPKDAASFTDEERRAQLERLTDRYLLRLIQTLAERQRAASVRRAVPQSAGEGEDADDHERERSGA